MLVLCDKAEQAVEYAKEDMIDDRELMDLAQAKIKNYSFPKHI